MPLINMIAIDGPAASGKSTLGKKLADRLGYLFFDTGVMYRAITWVALDRNLDISDESAITQLAEQVDIDLRPASQMDGRSSDILADGEDVTWAIRAPEIEAHVSQVSAYRGVRHALSMQQRRIGLRGKVVMVGRDIGTVVLPEAPLKIYLDASVEERASRRYHELSCRGEPADYAEILAALQQRDYIDSTRAGAPLRPADDAIILNSDAIYADEVLEQVFGLRKGTYGTT